MDTSWIELPNKHPAYKQGVKDFLEIASKNLVGGRTRCPCKKCQVDKWLYLDEVEKHLIFGHFYKEYKIWIYHGQGDVCESGLGDNVQTGSMDEQPVLGGDNMEGLLRAALGHNVPDSSVHNNDEQDMPEGGHTSSQPNQPPLVFDKKDEERFHKLHEAANKELYEGCTSFSKLSFLLHLYQMKCMFRWSAESFTMLLRLLVDAFPQIMDFPTSYYDGKKIITDLGLKYEKIHACPNNCSLYWGEYAKAEKCHVCKTSRYKTMKGKEGDTGEESIKHGDPAKVMRYFPLIPRLKRIYMCQKTAKDMVWHYEDREDDKMLRHPADALEWKGFDRDYPKFSEDPRSVRLGLASDGFNPYRLMNTNYSIWPVILIPYNLPPWICMKSTSFILSAIIPGKSSPGINIDVYLEPLLHELKLLWDGVDAFDAYKEQYFTLRGALMWTINDFPAYAMLSGWSTKGYKACPICTSSTNSFNFAGKICYCGHRQWLPSDHPDRSQGDLFDGTEEYRHHPLPASGSEILKQQEGINYVYGMPKKTTQKKKGKRKVGTCDDDDDDDAGDESLWTKRSKFFDLPYWAHHRIRHNLDVMHIEKNVCDNLLGTLLNMDGKSRDNEAAREAIKDLNIKPHLWLKSRPNSQQRDMPPASYSMSTLEKERFLKVLQKLKAPDGYGSNLSRCVNLKNRKLLNLKSHDNHVLMQDLFPIALRASRATKIVELISDLSSFFKDLCSTTINPDRLDELQSRIVLTLCEMEKEFLPPFFTIMVHLLVHLVDEVKYGGPVQYRWMYPIERYLAHLKSYVSNKALPEGCIAEGYFLEETITFCSRYLESIEIRFCRLKRNDDGSSSMGNYLFNSGGRVVGMNNLIHLDDKSLKQAHRYVLLHSDEMVDLREEFLRQKKIEFHSRGLQIKENSETEWIINEFSDWLRTQVHNIDATNDLGNLRKALARGLSDVARKVSSYVINGYKFQTVNRERFRKTQNSGVMVEAVGQVYYGKLTDIYELNYFGEFTVVMFRCDWVDIHRGLKAYRNGGARVNFSKLMHTGQRLQDDPFVFSSQVQQVFYVDDEMQPGWSHVVRTKPRDLFDLT